jgi:hypothetical protein
MEHISDHRALPDRTLNLYLYPVGLWAAVLLVLFVTGYIAYAIPLCYVVALWQIGLSAIWGRGLLSRLKSGELTNAEAHAGVRSVGNILAASSLAPAIVFLANDPLAPAAWSTTIGTAIVAALATGAIALLTRIGSRWTHGAAIAIACLAMPLNATGAVTVAAMVGLYDVVVDTAPLPDELKTPVRRREGKRDRER